MTKQLDDELEESARRLVKLLDFGADTIRKQLDAADVDPRFLKTALTASHKYIQWAEDVQHHEYRRTMPVTNTSRASNTIGYRYTQPTSQP